MSLWCNYCLNEKELWDKLNLNETELKYIYRQMLNMLCGWNDVWITQLIQSVLDKCRWLKTHTGDSSFQDILNIQKIRQYLTPAIRGEKLDGLLSNLISSRLTEEKKLDYLITQVEMREMNENTESHEVWKETDSCECKSVGDSILPDVTNDDTQMQVNVIWY